MSTSQAVRQAVADLTAELRRVEGEAEKLRKAVAALSALDGDATSESSATVNRPRVIRSRTDAQDGPNAFDLARKIFAENPGKSWTAPELRDALQAHGWQTGSDRPTNVVRSMLFKMSERGEIFRTEHGAYALEPPVTLLTEAGGP